MGAREAGPSPHALRCSAALSLDVSGLTSRNERREKRPPGTSLPSCERSRRGAQQEQALEALFLPKEQSRMGFLPMKAFSIHSSPGKAML